MIVGVAYVENSTPRSRSNRSMDLISPIVPTCTRSSNGSPRLRKRRAQCSTRGRCRWTRPSRASRRDDSGASLSRNTPNSTVFRRRASSVRVCDTRGPESPSLVISPADSPTPVEVGQAGVTAEGHLEVAVVGRRGRLGGQGAQHLPGEALVVRLGSADGRHAYGDRQRAGRLPEVGLEVTTGQRLGQDQGTRLAHRDPEVL